jgi:hypothetical protein
MRHRLDVPYRRPERWGPSLHRDDRGSQLFRRDQKLSGAARTGGRRRFSAGKVLALLLNGRFTPLLDKTPKVTGRGSKQTRRRLSEGGGGIRRVSGCGNVGVTVVRGGSKALICRDRSSCFTAGCKCGHCAAPIDDFPKAGFLRGRSLIGGELDIFLGLRRPSSYTGWRAKYQSRIEYCTPSKHIICVKLCVNEVESKFVYHCFVPRLLDSQDNNPN